MRKQEFIDNVDFANSAILQVVEIHIMCAYTKQVRYMIFLSSNRKKSCI